MGCGAKGGDGAGVVARADLGRGEFWVADRAKEVVLESGVSGSWPYEIRLIASLQPPSENMWKGLRCSVRWRKCDVTRLCGRTVSGRRRISALRANVNLVPISCYTLAIDLGTLEHPRSYTKPLNLHSLSI